MKNHCHTNTDPTLPVIEENTLVFKRQQHIILSTKIPRSLQILKLLPQRTSIYSFDLSFIQLNNNMSSSAMDKKYIT